MAKKSNRQRGLAAPPNLQLQQQAEQQRREDKERAEAEAKAKAEADAATAKAKAELEERERAEAKAKAEANASKATKTEAVRKTAAKKADTLLADFAGDPPHEAEDGCYSFNQRDRWHGTKPGLLDGWHHGSGWAIRIKGGHPVEAVREDHPAFPKRSKRAA